MHSKTPTAPGRLAPPSTKERVATPAEHKMKRLHEAKTRRIAEALAAGLNAAVEAGKPIR
jgi:hypothetical protein